MNDLTETSKTPVWFKAILLLGMLLFAFYASTHMVAAGDTWVAMACRRHFDHHGVDTVEPFSFNSHKAGPSDETLTKQGWPEWTHGIIKKIHPTGWIDQNWLTQLIYYKLATWFGSDGHYAWDTLVYWKFGLYFITVLLVYAIGRVLGVPPLLAAASACLAMVVGRTFYDIRPAGYSNMLVPAFILILAMTVRRNFRWIWLLVPVVIFWANVHGGYIYAFIMLVPFIGIHLLLRLPRRWSLCLGFIGLWGVLYLMSYKFISGYSNMIEQFYMQVQQVYGLSNADIAHNIENTRQAVFGYDPGTISLISNKMLIVWGMLGIVSVVLSSLKNINAGIFYFYHYLAGGLFAISLLPRFLVTTSKNLPSYFPPYVTSALLSFLFVCVVGTLLISAMAFKKEAFASLSPRGICHTIGASVAAFAAMIIFNPFHLTNLTHTFEISVSKHAESWRQVNEWKPAFDFMDKTTIIPNPVGEQEWFGVLCILAAVVIVIWLTGYFLKPRSPKPVGKRARSKPEPIETSAWPKINLAIIVISFLTIYMAIRSRRFIAIAGSAAAPIVMLLIYQCWEMITARIRFSQTNQLSAQSIPPVVMHIVRGFVIVVLMALSLIWGSKYKHIYLDPYPMDAKYNSVFMRMTASYLKPIEADEFIRFNNLSGRIFNYWTEGGAVALGQTPDPQTGQIPLKLFMDGRAQAAYNHDIYRLWQNIFSGGPIAIAEQAKNRDKMSDKTYQQIGEWINGQLEERDVWVTLMPSSQEKSTFIRALQKTGSWKTAYIDDVQHMLVDKKTAKGTALLSQILNGQAQFPNAYTKDLTTFMVIMENAVSDRYSDLYKLAKEAFTLHPTPTTAMMLLKLRGTPAILDDFTDYLNNFIEQKKTYQNEDGYQQRLRAAIVAADYLAVEDPDNRSRYNTLIQQFTLESESIDERQLW